MPTDLGQTQHTEQTYKRHVPFSRLVQNFSVATRRILEATPGGWPEKAKWFAIAATGHRMRSLGSLSSTASVGFAAHATRKEYDKIQLALLRLHDIKSGNLVNRLYAGNLWSTRRNINHRQGRPYTVPTPRTTNNHQNMYAIPTANINDTQPPEALAKRPRRKKDGNKKDDGNGQTAPHTTKIGVSKGVDDQADAYGGRCPYGCGQIKWRDTKPNIPLGATQTNQARIRCKECNKDFHVNKGTCVLCSTYPSYCICTKKKPPGIGWQRNLTPLQDWIQPAEEKQTKGDPRPSNDAEEQGGITQPEPATHQGSGNIYILPQEIHDVIAAAEDKRQTWTILGHKYLEFQIKGEGEPQEIFKLRKMTNILYAITTERHQDDHDKYDVVLIQWIGYRVKSHILAKTQDN